MTASSNNSARYDEKKKTLNGVPIWLLFIDKEFHKENDPMFFDHKSKSSSNVLGYRDGGEPGFHDSMTSAFEYVFANLNKKLDADELKKIRSLCIHKVEHIGRLAYGDISDDFSLEEYKLEYNNTMFDPARYGFMSSYPMSSEAKDEFKALVFDQKSQEGGATL